MKKKSKSSGKPQTFAQKFDQWVDQHRPTLFHPEKSWLKYLSLKAGTAAVRGTYKLSKTTLRETYYALTPEQMPDPRIESSQELWHAISETSPIDLALVSSDIKAKISKPLPIYDALIRNLIAPDLTEPPFPENGDAIAQARWRDEARRYLNTYHSGSLNALAQPILAAIDAITPYLPPPTDSDITVPILDLIPDIPKTVEAMVMCFYGRDALQQGLYSKLRERLDANATNEKGELVPPTKSKLPPRDIPKAYLDGTPLLPLFNAKLPFSIPEHIRFEHTWVLAGTGFGKTTWLAGQLKKDIERIKRGECSAIVMDSQNSLIPQLMRLDVPKVIIDPTDIDHPIALNLFDIGLAAAKTEAERFSLLEGAIKMFQFMIGSLFDQPMTPRQATLFAYLAELIITQVKGATIYTFRDLLDHGRAKRYRDAWLRASEEVRDYFETEYFTNSDTRNTAAQVLTRLRTLLRSRAFVNMFASPVSKIDLGAEMNAGKLILINTDKDFLTSDGTKMFGRFWIAQINQAAIRRAKHDKKLPAYVYIDECMDYLAGGDPKVEEILDQSRKQNIGLTLIHHRTAQLKSESLVEALDSNTSTKIVGSLNVNDQARMPRMLNTDAEFLKTLKPKQTFGCYVKGVTQTAIPISFPNTILSPELSDEQFSVMIESNRKKYCYSPQPKEEHSGSEHQSSEDEPINMKPSKDY
jgi:hypothetical protein